MAKRRELHWRCEVSPSESSYGYGRWRELGKRWTIHRIVLGNNIHYRINDSFVLYGGVYQCPTLQAAKDWCGGLRDE